MMSDRFPVRTLPTVALGAILVGFSGVNPLPTTGTPSPTHEVVVETFPQRLTPRQRHLLEAALQSAERRDSSYSQLRDILAVASAYQKLGDDIKANVLLEKAVQLNQSSSNSIDIDLRLARNSIALDKFDQADQLLQQALSTPSSPVRTNSLADIARLYSLFPEVDLIQNRLDSIYTLIPTQLEDPFHNFGAVLRGIATAYRHLEDAEVVKSGAAHLSKLASSQLLSVYPKPSSLTHFFEHPASFFKLSESKIDQRGGLFLSDMVMTYAFLYGDIANLYRKQGDSSAAQEHIEKALLLMRILPPSRRDRSRYQSILQGLALESVQLGNNDQAQQLLAEADAQSYLGQRSQNSFVDHRTQLAIAYSFANDQQNAQRILQQTVNHIQTLANTEKTALGKQNAYHLVHGVARAYARMGAVDQQQALLKQTFDALVAIDLSGETSIVKSQVLDDATRIYREISDHQLAREQLTILEARANDADFSNTRMFRLKELAVAAAQRESYADAERFAKATLDAAQSLPGGKFPSVRIIVIADAISHLADPEAVRLGLEQMNQIGADILQGEPVDDRLHRRLVDIFLGAL